MTPASGDLLYRFLAARAADGWTTGAAWWVGGHGRAVSHGAVGRTAAGPKAGPVRERTPFDLASLTKPLVTAPLLVMLEQEGRLELSAPLANHLPELAASPYARRSLLACASHTAGLPAWWPLYVEASTLEGYLTRIAALPPAVAEGETLYSDLGYILLGAAVERAAGRSLDTLFRERVAGPLALRFTGFPTPDRAFPEAAATERDNSFERRLAGERGAAHPWRTRIGRGEVHDANAHGLGGIAGHAGLFGTAAEVARIAHGLLVTEELGLQPASRRRLLEVVPPSLGRTVGLVTAAHAGAARGILADGSPGHTGFTGTSVWLEPETAAVLVLLTNRVHPVVPVRPFTCLRRAFHRLARGMTAGERRVRGGPTTMES